MLQNVCSVVTKASTVDLTQSKGIQTGPELLWTPQLIKQPASLEGLSGHFYPKWTQVHFCSVRWTKKNVLLATCTNTELAQSNSWLSQKAGGEEGALTTAPVTLELKKNLVCAPQKYSRVSAPARAAPGPVNACSGTVSPFPHLHNPTWIPLSAFWWLA